MDCVPPPLPEHLRFVYSAYRDLDTDRSVGFGLGPLRWSSIDAYCRRYGIDDIDEFEWFRELIGVMADEAAQKD